MLVSADSHSFDCVPQICLNLLGRCCYKESVLHLVGEHSVAGFINEWHKKHSNDRNQPDPKQ